MGSPLSPIIANIFMEFLEDITLQTANIKPSLWLRYVDDTFTLWPHNRQSLNMFLEHLNSLRPTIKFTMEVESNHQLPFLDVMVECTNSNSIITKVYRKPTHTDRYLNYRSYHSHSVKNGIIHTLKHRVKTICRDEITLTEEMEHLKSVFKKNGYPCDTVNRALHHQRNKRRSKEEQTQRTEVTTTIPYVKGVSERIRRICVKHNIKVIFHSGRTLRSILSHVKPQPDLLNHPGVIYRIPCLDCDRSYIEETGRTLRVRLSEHQRCCKNFETQKSAVAQHCLEEHHRIDWQGSTVIEKESIWHKRRIKEAIHIKSFPNLRPRT